MELIKVSAKEYGQIVGKKGPVFCSEPFLELNREKVDAIHYLILKNSKPRLAFAIGEKDGEWKAPFSAPFSVPIELKKSTDIEYYWEFAKLLKDYVKNQGGKNINIYLQPDIYYSQQNSKIVNALLGNGFSILYQEVNFSLNLEKCTSLSYENIIHYNARKNLRIANQLNLKFVKCEDDESKKQAYDVIKINRESKGYYLAMTYKQVKDTTEIVEHEFFLVKKDNINIAAAIVFHVTDEIVQVVYWGDIPDVGQFKPINYIAYELIKYYENTNIKKIDIGPSSPNGIPNFGLCNFKESIGCEVSGKIRFFKEICKGNK